MKRNLLLVISALFVISLIIAVSSLAIAKKATTQTKGSNTSIEKMIEACEKNPEMVKYMEKTFGRDWKKHHEEMKKNMKNCPMMNGEGGGMMGGKGGMMGGGKGSMMNGKGMMRGKGNSMMQGGGTMM